MQKKALKSTLVACSLALSGAAFAAAPSGAMLGNTCAGCHGTDGNSQGPATPTIAGMNAEVMVETMQGFKSGAINSTIMTRIAKGYSDDEIKAMAGFFAKKKFAPAKQSADAKLADKGAKLHKKYCEKCHEDGGKSNEEGGVLAGQWMPYMSYTMADFMSGKREMGKKMKKKVDKMHKKEGDAGIKALLNFYANAK
jgi:sulfide dehydrogenase cytochrome subunit